MKLYLGLNGISFEQINRINDSLPLSFRKLINKAKIIESSVPGSESGLVASMLERKEINDSQIIDYYYPHNTLLEAKSSKKTLIAGLKIKVSEGISVYEDKAELITYPKKLNNKCNDFYTGFEKTKRLSPSTAITMLERKYASVKGLAFTMEPEKVIFNFDVLSHALHYTNNEKFLIKIITGLEKMFNDMHHYFEEIVVFSLYGMNPVAKTDFFFNRWLEKEGLLKFSNKTKIVGTKLLSKTASMVVGSENVATLSSKIVKKGNENYFSKLPIIDYAKTSTYLHSPHSLYAKNPETVAKKLSKLKIINSYKIKGKVITMNLNPEYFPRAGYNIRISSKHKTRRKEKFTHYFPNNGFCSKKNSEVKALLTL
jgi:hypothetical protein